MKYSNVVVAGGGVLGSQIAFQAAYCGFNVTIWLRSEGSIGRTQPKIDHLKQTYIEAIEKMAEDKNAWCAGLADEDTFDKEECLKKVENAYANLKLELDMAKAVADADLVIESMAENEKDKIAFYEKLSPLLPEKTVIVMAASIITDSRANRFRHLIQMNDNIFNGLFRPFRIIFHCFVQICHISRMMPAMMDFHRFCVNNRF